VTREIRLEAVVVWDSRPAAAALARRVIEELAAIDPVRLRRCARRECSLFFYDSSRSATQRWHSEVPCGWRERQQRRRARTDPPTVAIGISEALGITGDAGMMQT
jgi:predicted RNA-binding Zn ribbon-like protein